MAKNRIPPSQRPERQLTVGTWPKQADVQMQVWPAPDDVLTDPAALIPRLQGYVGALLQAEELGPMAVFVCPLGEEVIRAMPLDLTIEHRGKDHADRCIRELVRVTKPRAVAFLCEAFANDSGCTDDSRSLEGQQGTKDEAMITFETADGRCECWHADIVAANGKRSLGTWQKMKGYSAKRFGSFYPQHAN